MLTGSLYKPLYLASRAWISSARASLHAKLCLAFSLPLSHKLTPQHTHTQTHKPLKATQSSIGGVGAVRRAAGYSRKLFTFHCCKQTKVQTWHILTSHRKADSLCFPLLSSYKSSIKSVLSHSIFKPKSSVEHRLAAVQYGCTEGEHKRLEGRQINLQKVEIYDFIKNAQLGRINLQEILTSRHESLFSESEKSIQVYSSLF